MSPFRIEPRYRHFEIQASGSPKVVAPYPLTGLALALDFPTAHLPTLLELPTKSTVVALIRPSVIDGMKDLPCGEPGPHYHQI